MTNRIKALTVILEDNVREDDTQPLVNAIKLLKGVLDVSTQIAESEHHIARIQVRAELGQKLMNVLYPEYVESK